MDVIVVGGGASGMSAAIVSKRCGNNVTIIEKNNILGKKLLLTGNGRCNFFNSDMSLKNYFNDSSVSRFVNDDNLKKLNIFFDSLGIISRIKDGYYYPYSNTSSAIQNALLKEINNLNIKIINEEVIDISYNGSFYIKTNNNTYYANKLIMSTGGITYPKTGSDGFGYKLLKKLGHTVINPRCALSPLVTSMNVTSWKNIRATISAKLYVNNRFVWEENGEAQLTDYGISGICIMNLSRFIESKNANKLLINFLPFVSNPFDFINKRNTNLNNRTIIELLESAINYKLLYFILKKSNIDVNSKWNDINKNKKELLIKNITEFELPIIDTKGADYSEVTTGGVDLKEITNNCESKIIPNLFITGELLNIDGVCGGYNLTNAWISGILAGEDNDKS